MITAADLFFRTVGLNEVVVGAVAVEAFGLNVSVGFVFGAKFLPLTVLSVNIVGVLAATFEGGPKIEN